MMLLHSNYFNLHERADIARLSKVYKLFNGGMFRTCKYEEAMKLLKTGKWFDKTNYLPHEEVLNYEQPRQRLCSHQSQETSEREKPSDQQHQPNHAYHAGEESSRETDGSRSSNGEVRKGRRPRGITNGTRRENS